MKKQTTNKYNSRKKANNKKIIIVVAAIIAAAAIGLTLFLTLGKDSGEKETVSIDVTRNDFSLSESVIMTLSSDSERYSSTLTNAYGISSSKTSDFYEAPENWLAFDITMDIVNTGSTEVSIVGFDVSNNGKNDMYVNSKVGGELSLAPGASYPISASILCENGDLSLEEAKKLADQLSIDIIFSKKPVENDDGTQSVETQYSVKVQ